MKKIACINKKTVYLSILLILTAYTGLCQQLAFDKLSTNKNLSNTTIHTLIEDEYGFMWVGTNNGLNRYDGYGFTSIQLPENQNSTYQNPSILTLFKDHNDIIWTGVKDGGILAYNTKNDQFIDSEFTSSDIIDWNTTTVRTIYEDSRHWLWIGTYGGGCVVLNKDRKILFHFATYLEKKNHKLSNDYVFDFAEDRTGNVYIATAGEGLNLFNIATRKISHLHSPFAEDMNSFSKTLCLDQNETLWIGTEGNGLYSFTLPTDSWLAYTQTDFYNPISSNIITDILLDIDNSIWVSTDGGGLNHIRADRKEIKSYRYAPSDPNGLSTDALYALHFDRSRNLWVGTFNGGLNIMKTITSPFCTEPKIDDQRKSGLRSVLGLETDNNGRTWIGTDGGGMFYFERDSKIVKLHNANHFLSGDQFNKVITCLKMGKDNAIWYGSFNKGLYRFDLRTKIIENFKHIENDPNTLIHNNVWDIEIDTSGGIWIATLGGGIDYYNPQTNKFRSYGDFQGRLSDYQVVDILLDQDEKNLWIATESKGLNKLNIQTNEIVNYRYANEDEQRLTSDRLQSLFEDHAGNIWIVSKEGIDKYNAESNQIKQVDVEHGFPIGIVYSVLEDQKHFIWISTSTGIHRLNPSDNSLIEFAPDQGLNSCLYNSKATHILQNGKLLFGGVHGYTLIDSDNVMLNKNEANPVFTFLRVADSKIGTGTIDDRTILTKNMNHSEAEVNLNYNDRGISFEFSSTEYTTPELNKFAYKLVGYEEEWKYTDHTQRKVSYSTLPIGDYVLKIKAANSSGTWSPKVRSLNIHVRPPFWKTKIFITILVILSISLLVLTYKWLLARQQKELGIQVLEQKREILLLRNENLEQEVQNKKAEISASAFQIARKNQFLTDLKNRINKIRKSKELASETQLRRLVSTIDAEIKKDDYWSQFKQLFNETYKNFEKQLNDKYPNLTQNDHRLCSFIKMKLNNREIASVLNISSSSVEQSKYRIKKKMNLDKDEDLNTYLQNIDAKKQV